jgi:hypothetical protein
MLQIVLQWILAADAAAPLAAAPAIDAPIATARIESISPDLDGRGGVLTVRAIALDGGRDSFAFGGKRCKAHRIDAAVLTQLFEAMRQRQGVTVTGSGSGDVPCLAQVTFFAPDA